MTTSSVGSRNKAFHKAKGKVAFDVIFSLEGVH